MHTPVVYRVEPVDVRKALEAVRSRVKSLREPRLYQLAFVLQVLVRSGRADQWLSWESQPPRTAKPIGRGLFTTAMRELFELPATALVRPKSRVMDALGSPSRLMVDPFYGANGHPSVVRSGSAATKTRKDSVRVPLTHSSWVWSDSSVGSGEPLAPVEYNPVNSLNQQNGVRCALPVLDAVATGDPAAVYSVDRVECPHRGKGSFLCDINGAQCASMGAGEGREATKPRLLVPPAGGAGASLLLPNTIQTLVAEATAGGRLPLPKATDIGLLVAWAAANGTGDRLDWNRLTRLVGPTGLRTLTDTGQDAPRSSASSGPVAATNSTVEETEVGPA